MQKLDDAIAINGRSLAQELEARVVGHFKLEDIFGDPRRLTFMAYLADRIRRVEEQFGGRFETDPATHAMASLAAKEVFEAAAPFGGNTLHYLRLMVEAHEKAEAEAAQVPENGA